jgi:LacI family transcriptional regulator
MNGFQKKRVTQADVAKRAHVSQAMVSYIVNENGTVSVPDETRQRILAAMDDLGYVPNITARRLRSSKTFTIAGIIPDVTNPFYPAFERGIQDVADQQGYDLIMYNTDGSEHKERKYVESLMQGRVDGLIGVFFHLSAKDLLPLLEQNLHVVRLEAMQKQPGPLPLDNIFIDNIAAAAEAVNYLIQRGHRRIGMLTSHEGPAKYRVQGYRKALTEHSIPVDESSIRHGSYDEDGGYDTMRGLLEGKEVPSAVFAANDLMAMGALVAIREARLSVPDDVAVVGFDDIPSAKLVFPPLTTIAQYQRQMGQRAAEMLFERLNGAAPSSGRSVQMPYQLVVRTSA